MSIRLRLTAWYAAALTGTLAITAAVAIVTFQRASEAQLDAELGERARLVLASVAPDRESTLRLGDEQHDGRAADTVVFLFGAGGALADASTRSSAAERAALDLATRADPPPYATVEVAGERLRLHLVRIEQGGTFHGSLVVGRPLVPLERSVAQLVTTLLLLLPLALVLAVAGGYVLARRALAPIERLRLAADGIGTLEPQRRLLVHGPDDEIGRLAGTLDRMLARIAHSVERERRFTADASHELRNPVAAILAEAEITASRPRDAASYREALAHIQVEAARMGRLVDQLLLLARADAGQLGSPAAPVDLQEIAERSGRRSAARAEARGVRLAVRTGPPSLLSGDADAISRALDNLVDNAIRHSPRGAAVDVAVEAAGGEVIVSVRDEGPGFGAGELPHLFQRFRRGRDAGPGAGLGLAIVRSVVEAHRGRVSAADRPSGGAEITMAFPVG